MNNNLVGWILDVLTNRTQIVKVNGILSDLICLSTGSPQGCVLSPLLYILYTNLCQSKHFKSTILKSADYTVIVSLLHNNESGHGPVIEEFVTWCDESYLIKTKDMIIDLRTHVSCCDTTIIKDQAVDCVDSYKYLGTIKDSNLTFEKNWECM